MDLNQGQGEANVVFEAQAHIHRHILNYATSMSLGCALELGIPDIVHKHGQPITIQELVSKLNLPIEKTLYLRRLMRLLIHSNFFSITNLHDQDDQAGYVLTAASKLLLNNTSKNQQNLLPFARLALDPHIVTPWKFLGKWFNENKSTNAFENAYGIPIWEFTNKNPKFNRIFNDGMESDSQTMSLVVKDCQAIFEGVESLVDVGGGTGLFAKLLIEAFPHMTCTNVLHDWSEDKALKILKRCREAIRFAGDKGKVIIIDMVVDDKHDQHEITETKMIFDMLMMVLVAGSERTKVEWEKLFLEAGFSQHKITPKFGLRSLIEVFP
ncbi:hypothetical protein M8C21_025041 [Ambrosia artemisiifolia]|uniref:Trans-resveratrol di-O-methyltransferase n=1 Tax=Ambrosia artemisiifolia TaxID=4212 RepID=A0AAD5D9C2_AMBAR|nr:hypothetical protein M8C21_025041 [Ambrosia artemisiifolia]